MAKQTVTLDDVMALVTKLQAENAELKAKANGGAHAKVTCKVGEKHGNLCIYGLGRFPVSLYLSQFDLLDKHWADVQAFVKANRAKFSTKDND